MPSYNYLSGPQLINGQITMNGLGNAITDVLKSIADVYARLNESLGKISASVADLKAALNKISADQAKQAQTMFAIEQAVNPVLKNFAKTHAPSSALRG
jgi:hypothetical protein